MKKILTVGVYDFFHYGHLKVFEQAKSIDMNGELIVAVQESEYIRKYKPDSNIFYSTEVRCDLIRALRCVDHVVTYRDVNQIVRELDFDVFAVGEDQKHAGFMEAIRYCEETGKEVVRLHRTPNISSSSIKYALHNDK